jgi:DNA-binding CsgD family transcriptional regulator
MLPRSEALSQLLGTLYEAVSDPALWERFLQQLGEQTGATAAALVVYDAGQESYALSSHWHFDPEATKLYGQYYGALDIWGRRGLSKRTSLVCSSETLCSSAELVHTEIYNDFLTRFGLEHGMFTVFENTGSRFVSCSLFRNASRGPFEVCEMDISRFLAPHLHRAIKLHAQFSEMRGRSTGIEAALDLLPTGVVFLGAMGKVVLTNRAASQILSERDGLLATAASLCAERAAESDLLANAIRQALQGVNGASVGGTVFVSRRARPPLQVLVCPVRQSSASLLFAPQPIFAIAFITDPYRRQRPAQEILRALFQFTPAECRIALLLSDGLEPAKIADMLGVSRNTVRSQIKSIFAKTGAKRQAELIRLLLTHSEPVIRQQGLHS